MTTNTDSLGVGSKQSEQPVPELYCSKCLTIIKQVSEADDLGTITFRCENGHQTTNKAEEAAKAGLSLPEIRLYTLEQKTNSEKLRARIATETTPEAIRAFKEKAAKANQERIQRERKQEEMIEHPPERRADVPLSEINDYLEDGWKVAKQYKDHAIMVKKPEKNQVEEKGSQADRLIEYCLEEATEFFKDQHQTPYVRVYKTCAIAQFAQFTTSTVPIEAKSILKGDEDGEKNIPLHKLQESSQIAQVPQLTQSTEHYELMKIGSKQFKHWLSYLMYQKEQKGANTDAINVVINTISGKCQNEGKTYTLYNRVAPDPSGDGSIWLDTANNSWQAIHITKSGWEIINDPPILFYRFKHQKPLLLPQQPENLETARIYAEKFFEHTNIKDTEDSKNNKLLVLCTIISYIIPTIPHPNIMAYGVQGSCKSYFFKQIRRLIDPASAELLDIPHDKRDLVQQLYHNWLCFFDNLTYLSMDLSNLLCKVVTGAGFSKRELYSDDDDIIYQFVRCLGMNGINQVAKKGDLIDRSILIELQKVDKRLLESEVDAAFDKDIPCILGGMLTLLSNAMNRFDSLKPQEWLRLADFHKWGCAIAEALGKTSEEFTKAYEREVENQADETINAEPVGVALLKYLEQTPSFNGTATELLEALKAVAFNNKINTSAKTWPQEAQPLSRKLNELKPALFKKGYEITNKNGTPRKLIISKTNQTCLIATSIQTEISFNPPVAPEAKIAAAELPTQEAVTQTYNLIRLLQNDYDGAIPIDKIPNKAALKALLTDGKIFNIDDGHVGVVA